MRHQSKAIASQAVNHYLRLTEKFRHQAVFAENAQVIAQQLMELVQACESGQISQETLGYSELQDLYSVLGIISSNDSVAEDFRVQLLNWALERQS